MVERTSQNMECKKSEVAKCLNIYWKELAEYTRLHLHYLGITLKSTTKLV